MSPPAFEAEYGLDGRIGDSSVQAGAPTGTSPYTSSVETCTMPDSRLARMVEQHLGAEDVGHDELRRAR